MSHCTKKDSYEECELNILRHAVDIAEEKQKIKGRNDKEVTDIMNVVENFLRKRKLICYGGTAINNILPSEDQFYDYSVELPDYDFYSPNALKDTKDLANIYVKEGFEDVQAKAGVHHGTYKVFVKNIPVADVSQLDPKLFKYIYRDAKQFNGIKYCPPNFLRMAMYLELSRPFGDVSRWEKVLKRLTLLNKHYPLQVDNCFDQVFKREFKADDKKTLNIYAIVRDSFLDQGLVFFGGHAINLYKNHMGKSYKMIIDKIPDFDVLSNNPMQSSQIVLERLKEKGFKHITSKKHAPIGEIISEHYEIRVGKQPVGFIYKPLACHSYNNIHIKGKKVKVASIDTMLSFYLAFYYADKPYYDKNKILCFAKMLFDVQKKNRLSQKGVLRRFSITCYGKQGTLADMRNEKTEMFKALKNKRNSKEYEEWFLRYEPGEKNKQEKKKKTKKRKKRKKSRKSRKVYKTNSDYKLKPF
tara:strand:+ start:1829 stop:3238 length:1410 start_codon:yes stop_codon:yes gene_type:complete